MSVTWVAEAPRSSSRLSSVVIPAGRRLTELEPQSMESVCLVVAILDLYIVGVNRRNCGLALGGRERESYYQCNPIHLLQTFLIGLQFIDSLNSAYSIKCELSNVKVVLSPNNSK